MAIFHYRASVGSRKAGQSSVAMSAYRSGERLEEAKTGEVKDYSRRYGVEKKGILAPEDAPEWAHDRGELWNRVEAAETRKDAQLCRNIQMALPRELSDQERAELVREFARSQFVSKGMVVDYAIHAPHVSAHGESNENYHAHLLTTTRRLDSTTETGFSAKKEAAWRPDFARGKGRNTGLAKGDLLEAERAAWADAQNRALERAGEHVRVDHRTLAAQGIEREPTKHLGPAATAMERRGEVSEIGTRNREIAQAQAQKAKELEANRTLSGVYGARADKARMALGRAEKTTAAAAATLKRVEKEAELAEVRRAERAAIEAAAAAKAGPVVRNAEELRAAQGKPPQEPQKAPQKAQEQTIRSRVAATPEKAQEAPKAAQTPTPERKPGPVVNSELWAKVKVAKEAAKTPDPAPATEKEEAPERPKTPIHKSVESLREQRAAELAAKLEQIGAKPGAQSPKAETKPAQKPQEAVKASPAQEAVKAAKNYEFYANQLKAIDARMKEISDDDRPYNQSLETKAGTHLKDIERHQKQKEYLQAGFWERRSKDFKEARDDIKKMKDWGHAEYCQSDKKVIKHIDAQIEYHSKELEKINPELTAYLLKQEEYDKRTNAPGYKENQLKKYKEFEKMRPEAANRMKEWRSVAIDRIKALSPKDRAKVLDFLSKNVTAKVCQKITSEVTRALQPLRSQGRDGR